VYLEIQPEPRECDAVFAGLPVESVWRRSQTTSPVQFIQNANTLIPNQPDWLLYLPPANELSSQNTLNLVHGGHAYLIKLSAQASPMPFTVRGLPVVRSPVWLPGSLSFMGVGLAAASSYRVGEMFAGSAAHNNQPVYRLNSTGQWQRAASNDLIRPGEAIWVHSATDSKFQGPIHLSLEQRTGLDYGESAQEQVIILRNDSIQSRTVTVRLADSAPVGSGTSPALAGPVPLDYWRPDFATLNYQAGERPWAELTQQARTLSPGQSWRLRLAVDRRRMAAYTAQIPPAGVLYQSILEVTDDKGARRLVPVTAANGVTGVPAASRLTRAGRSPMNQELTDPRAGLWVGYVIANAVSETAHPSDPNSPTPTGAPFQFRILVHVDGAGQARLVQQVIQMWKPGTYQTVPNPENPSQTIQEMVEPGRTVLLTDPSLVSHYSGIALTDGVPVGRRISTAAFSFSDPQLLTGDGFARTNQTIVGSVTVPFDDPLSPYLHRYHPDHNNLSEDNTQPRPEAFEVRRDLGFTFTATDPEGWTIAGWGVDRVGGTYSESIEGLHKPGTTIEIAGLFRLHRVSRVDTLNDTQSQTASVQ
jgi:hypothetical protein